MLGTFSPPTQVSDPDMHHGSCVTHMTWCMLGSLTSGFLWSWCQGNSRHSRRLHHPQFYVFGKRTMESVLFCVKPSMYTWFGIIFVAVRWIINRYMELVWSYSSELLHWHWIRYEPKWRHIADIIFECVDSALLLEPAMSRSNFQ